MSADLKRLLLVSYYFPPSGGSGVQRAVKLARYLPQYGWMPTVLTVHPDHAAYPDLDPSLAGDIPPGLRVERTYAWDPYALYAGLLGRKKEETIGVGFSTDRAGGRKESLARLIRANVFLPDARVGWVPFALRRGRRLLTEEPYDAVLTTGPPHSSHLIGRSIARRFGIAWAADFRDPWTDISYYHELPLSGVARRIDASLERSVLAGADAVITVSSDLKRLLSSKTSTPVYIIPNGFDEEDFKHVPLLREPDFVLTHTGTLTASQNPVSLWKAIRSLLDEGHLARLKIRMVGKVDGAVLESVREYCLEDRLELIGYVPHREAVRYMVGAGLLLLSINRSPDAECIITGKAFEYVASGRPVLGVGPRPGDAANLLDETGAGALYHYDDVEGIRKALLGHYIAWSGGAPLSGAAASSAAAYSRSSQAGRLVDLLNGLTLSDALTG